MMSERFTQSAGEWLAPGAPDADTVVSTRVRLARNVKGHPMPWHMSEEERSELGRDLRARIIESGVVDSNLYARIDDLSAIERELLVERHLISRELASGHGERGVVFSPAESTSIMINEEDHLRIQVIRAGLQIDETWRLIRAVDDALEQVITYAFSPEFGYLTTCPTNLGTGMRVSVMVHLPTLVSTRQIDKVFLAASKVGLVLRGLYGEGSQSLGDLFQISNQVTLGKSEEEILRDVQRMVLTIIEWERGVRSLLLERDRMKVEETIRGAYQRLREVNEITSEEAMKLLSEVRLGIHLNVLSGVDQQAVNELFLFTQPAHLQFLRGTGLPPDERDRIRARYIRDRLNSEN